MEFSYKLSEADYLLASKIVVKRPKRAWARAQSYVSLGCLLVIVWGALLTGMMLEWSDAGGGSLAEAPIGHLVLSSIIPSLILFWFSLWLPRLVMRWPRLMSGREHFRTDPACQAETTAIITSESAKFRSDNGNSESAWDCFSTWGERNGVLVLVTRAGGRKILKISGLSAVEKEDLHAILHVALPKG